MANKKYQDYPAGTYDTSKIFLQADPTTGALEKIFLPTLSSLPSQSGQSGKVLSTNGTAASWAVVANSGWSLTGNAGTTAGTNFLGTTDNTDLLFKTNNATGLKIRSGGNALEIGNLGYGAVTSPVRVSFGQSWGSSTGGAYQNLKLVISGDASTPSSNDYGIGVSTGQMEFQTQAGGTIQFYPNRSTTPLLGVHSAGITTPFLNLGNTFTDSKISMYGSGGLGFGIGTSSTQLRFYIYDTSKHFAFFATVAGTTQLFTIKGTGQVGINNSTPHTSAILEITSTTQGLLIPRMSTSQKTAISAPATGLMVYDNTLNEMCFYNGSTWRTITST